MMVARIEMGPYVPTQTLSLYPSTNIVFIKRFLPIFAVFDHFWPNLVTFMPKFGLRNGHFGRFSVIFSEFKSLRSISKIAFNQSFVRVKDA